MSQVDSTHERLIATYRKKAKHYNITSRLYPVPGYPQQAQRRRAVRAPAASAAGDTVVDVACGTGQNFPLIEQAIGSEGRIVGVDLTDAMLAQAQQRVEEQRLEQCQPRAKPTRPRSSSPTEVDAILSTYALSHLPEPGAVIAHGAAALLARRALGRARSQGSRPRSPLAGAALRLDRRVDRAPSVGGGSQSHAGRAERLSWTRDVLRDGVPRCRLRQSGGGGSPYSTRPQ